jgi:putative membrane protein
VGFPETAHSLVGVALGLLLVFRTNASYDRFWEGRKQWGAMVNESRNLARSASVHLAAAPDLVRPLLMWTSVFAWATMHRLRGRSELGAIAAQLPPAEVLAVKAEGHGPLAVSRRMTALIAEARRRGLISDYVLISIDRNVQLLIDYMGACERIRNTRIPYAYMVHLRRALILYCYTLPFALLDRFGWGTIVAVLLIAYTLFGIEEIGVEIEDPFGEDLNDLPLDRICETIEGDLKNTAETLEPKTIEAAPLPLP